MDVKDEIFFNPPPVGSVGLFGQNENFQRIRHYGISIDLNSYPLDYLRVFSSYSLTRTKVKQGPFERNDLPITPKHAATIGLTYNPIKSLHITPVVQLVGSRFMLNDLDNKSSKLGKYYVADIKSSYNVGKFTVYFLVKNLFDRKYFDNGGIGGFPWGSRRAFNPAPERNFLLGTEVTF